MTTHSVQNNAAQTEGSKTYKDDYALGPDSICTHKKSDYRSRQAQMDGAVTAWGNAQMTAALPSTLMAPMTLYHTSQLGEALDTF